MAAERPVAIIGGGQAGLMAAETVRQYGLPVALYEAMPTVGHKLLLAGSSGLNITHAEPLDLFLRRYEHVPDHFIAALRAFPAHAVRAWASSLGTETFVASSGRVYPLVMRAAPLLRAWLARLRTADVSIHTRHRWLGWQPDGSLSFETPTGLQTVQPTATIFALGGASWPRTGSNGQWVDIFQTRNLQIAPLRPANCGFECGWSAHFRERYAGQPLKTVAFTLGAERKVGECVITDYGIEGSLIYAFAAQLRDTIATQGSTTLLLDLAPDRSAQQLAERLARPRGSRSLSNHLEKTIGLHGVKAGLLWEFVPKSQWQQPDTLAAAIKALPIPLNAPRPINEAISTAGGICFESLDENLMWREQPGTFFAGEMLDWEAPTGGYLLTACFATGRYVGAAAARWVTANTNP